ncbi:MAG: NADH-quinone oxidoreductase subunit J [Acidobacteria bacterium]|nr:NADH-quinone oxidoreductase subunit J [Acidobacteriota bacterium]
MELFTFGVLAFLTLVGAAGVIATRHPVHCAMFLLLCLCSVAGLFVALWAEFLAVVQLLVYAGGVMVLFLFVIMLVDLNRRGFDLEKVRVGHHPTRVQRAIWAVLTLAFAGVLLALLPGAGGVPGHHETVAALQGPDGGAGVLGNTAWIGTLLYVDYLVPFELASVLLLVAIVGAVILARRSEA